MVVNFYVIWDKVAKEAGPVFQAKNDGVARRNVNNILEKVADFDQAAYELRKICSFDNEKVEVCNIRNEVIDLEIPVIGEEA